ncbi:hypothetical protein [Rhodopseudomonas sp. RCAM05734]|uniref:hypothetical protein n=1 Tax=Rhodopseudomonas sp. RCAM05734 TaxID=3457549 RepID=UPI004044B7E4
MLPGIRFLFAAAVLLFSLLVFGFGATALLRSAREEVASLPIRRTPPEIIFSQPAEAPPRLAMLRLDAPAPADVSPALPPAPVEIAPDVATLTDSDKAAEPEKPAVPMTAEPAPVAANEAGPPAVEIAKPDVPAPEAPVAIAAVQPSGAEPPAAVAVPVAAVQQIEPTPAPAVDAPVGAAEPAVADADNISTRIATLGGPPVSVEPQPAVKLPVARPPVATATATKAERKRTIQRRREAAREAQRAQAAREARAARDARAAAQQANPFATPLQR